MRLKRLGAEDETALRSLFEANDRPSVTRYFDPFPLDAETARRLAHRSGRDLYWGIWEGPELVGLAMVRGWDAGYPQRSDGLLVDHGHHGRGIATEATRLMLAELRRAGEDLVRARVHDTNVGSLRMLELNGFVEIERGEGRVLLERRLGAESPS